MKCRKPQIGSLSVSLPPVLFVFFSLQLPPRLHLLFSFLEGGQWCLSPKAQRRWQGPSFSFITPPSKQSTHAHLLAVHFSPLHTSPSAIHPSISLYKHPPACLSKRLPDEEVGRGVEAEQQRNRRAKMEGEEPGRDGESRDGWRDGVGGWGLQGCVGREPGY